MPLPPLAVNNGEATVATYRVVQAGSGLVEGALISQEDRFGHKAPMLAFRAPWITPTMLGEMEKAGSVVRLTDDARTARRLEVVR